MKHKLIISKIFFVFIFLCLSIFIGYAAFLLINNKDLFIPSYINNPPAKYYEILNFQIKQNKIYLAKDGTDTIKYELNVNKNYEEEIIFTSSNPDVATVDDLGNVTAVSLGETDVIIKVKDEVRSVPIIVTDLIESIPIRYNAFKTVTPCNGYSKEENDMLDDILKTRVNDAGYATRAGVVAAVRFLTLEFPYKVPYFSENGRLNGGGYTNKVDGEGRYYHQGLYLHSSRFQSLSPKLYGPKVWGCYMYSYVAEHESRNGFDCSGFITWVLLNGGFDPGDIGAGISKILFDCTDLGPNIRIPEAIENNTLRVGDLLSGPDPDGGHIAILMGINDGIYYVGECLWHNNAYGAIIQTYSKDTLSKKFYWQIDMNDYYKEDGNLTDFWQ